jgi:hypothetical protein
MLTLVPGSNADRLGAIKNLLTEKDHPRLIGCNAGHGYNSSWSSKYHGELSFSAFR